MSFNIDKTLRSAKAEVKSGRPAQGRAILLQALEKFPDNSRLLSGLAEAHQAATGLPARPFAAPHMQLALQLKAQRGLPAAIESMDAWVRLNPSSPWAQGVLGGLLHEAALYPGAIRHLRLALKLDPKYREAGVNLARSHVACGDHAAALPVLDKVIAQFPDFPPALLTRARAHAALSRHAEALADFEAYLALQPSDSEARIDLAATLMMLSRLPAAKAELDSVLASHPENPRAMGVLGNLLLSMGDLEGAERSLETTLRLDPHSIHAFYNLGRVRDFSAGEPIIARMAALADSNGLETTDRAALHFGLAKAYEDIGDADQSFAHLTRGNDLRGSLVAYHIDDDRALLADLRQRFAVGSGPALAADSTLAHRPIFVVGMMRSGTTLMEQILSSHPLVDGAGEMEALPKLAAAEMALTEGPLPEAALRRIRDGYLAELAAEGRNRPVIVDKLPANFRMIGLIRKALPEARILHMRRDPVAVCWSIYKTLFTNLTIGYAHSLPDTIAYHDLYTGMMEEWRADFPDGFMDVDYEALTRNPEPTIRAVLDYCGLPFDPACLAPQENQRAVRTASLRQVRSGIYQGSSGKWRAFEPHLAPLIEHFRKD